MNFEMALHCALRRHGLTCPHLRKYVVARVADALWYVTALEEEFDEFQPGVHVRELHIRTADALFQRMPPMQDSGEGAREKMLQRHCDDVSALLGQAGVARCIVEVDMLWRNPPLGKYRLSYIEKTLPVPAGRLEIIRIRRDADIVSSLRIDGDADMLEPGAAAVLTIGGQVVDAFQHDAATNQWRLRSFAPPYSPLLIVALVYHEVAVCVYVRRDTVLRYYAHVAGVKYRRELALTGWDVTLAGGRRARITGGIMMMSPAADQL